MKRLLLVALTLPLASIALAQDPFVDPSPQQTQPAPQQQPQAYPQQQQPYPQQQPVYQQPQQQPQPAQQQVQRGARQTGVYLLSPIFLTGVEALAGDPDPNGPAGRDPGAGLGIGARFGWEFGMLIPEFHIGLASNQTRENTPALTHAYLSLGARLQFLNQSRFIPFVAAAVRFNFWFRDDAATTPWNVAAVVGGGLAIEMSPSFGLEIAADLIANFPTDDRALPFTELFIAPRLGGTFYF